LNTQKKNPKKMKVLERNEQDSGAEIKKITFCASLRNDGGFKESEGQRLKERVFPYSGNIMQGLWKLRSRFP
jgi:hypothetical protein